MRGQVYNCILAEVFQESSFGGGNTQKFISLQAINFMRRLRQRCKITGAASPSQRSVAGSKWRKCEYVIVRILPVYIFFRYQECGRKLVTHGTFFHKVLAWLARWKRF